jgi:hypothetical protein
MTEQKEATLRQKTILLLFNYPLRSKRIMDRFKKCITKNNRDEVFRGIIGHE